MLITIVIRYGSLKSRPSRGLAVPLFIAAWRFGVDRSVGPISGLASQNRSISQIAFVGGLATLRGLSCDVTTWMVYVCILLDWYLGLLA